MQNPRPPSTPFRENLLGSLLTPSQPHQIAANPTSTPHQPSPRPPSCPVELIMATIRENSPKRIRREISAPSVLPITQGPRPCQIARKGHSRAKAETQPKRTETREPRLVWLGLVWSGGQGVRWSDGQANPFPPLTGTPRAHALALPCARLGNYCRIPTYTYPDVRTTT